MLRYIIFSHDSTGEELEGVINPDRITKFCAVRFGNVLGSNGSVVPLFISQIENGGPITVTHKDISRYFISVSEAVSLILKAGLLCNGSEVFELDMGEPLNIYNLALKLLDYYHLELGKDIELEFIGLRPGEKLKEELLDEGGGYNVKFDGTMRIGYPLNFDYFELLGKLQDLLNSAFDDEFAIREYLFDIVPEYEKD